ncbi:hypothetical protein LTS02_005825 [Friedmanniomyces endolithicus]|nr:hypothetical protein LTS02_005825 [Friedmanniomyces endolithicus]
MASVAALEAFFARRKTAQASDDVSEVDTDAACEAEAEAEAVTNADGPPPFPQSPDFGPLRLPEYNILARSWSKDDKKANEVLTSAQYNKHFTEAVKNEANNLRRKRSEQITIRYARDTHLNFPELPGQHLNDELKRVANVFLCKGLVHDPYIYEALVAASATTVVQQTFIHQQGERKMRHSDGRPR